ncbi:NAD(P)H-dependent glycerol-3-phosphate dehydrogenase [bacterium SCSIO 12643]|nr:NAD(P)H-dependent glycerol-3-phosphate dehydrogenase [bacterium SCSIO 12643]
MTTLESIKVGVLGSGSWASAIVKMLCENLDSINWWVRNEKSAEHIMEYGHNPKYLTSVNFKTEKLNIYTDIDEVISNSDIIVLAIPSAFVVNAFEKYSINLDGKKLVTAVKGIIPEQNRIPVRFFHKEYGVDYSDMCMISGPCHAEEVALERLSYLTIAGQDETFNQQIADILACRYIKTTISDDLFGTELSAILKNIYSIASGIYAGIGYGDNFQAVLISNAIQEVERLIDAINPIHRDVLTSAYLGDLLVTAYSQFSRNRNFGFMIGKGYSVKTAQIEMDMVAEGYYAAKSLMEINKKFQVEIPIVEAVYNVLYHKISPIIEMKILAEKFS